MFYNVPLKIFYKILIFQFKHYNEIVIEKENSKPIWNETFIQTHPSLIILIVNDRLWLIFITHFFVTSNLHL